MINSLIRRISNFPLGQGPVTDKLSYYCQLYISVKEQNPDDEEVASIQVLLELSTIDCFDENVVQAKYDAFKRELSEYNSAPQSEQAQSLLNQISRGLQLLLNRYKKFYKIPTDMEIIFLMKKKIKSLSKLSYTNLTETQDDSSFDSSKFLINLWRNIINTELSIFTLNRDLTPLSQDVKDALDLKSQHIKLTELEQNYITLMDHLLEDLQKAQFNNSEAKNLFEKREEFVRDKLVKFMKAILIKSVEYKEAKTILGKSLYKKDPQRIESLQRVTTQAQQLNADDNRTVLEKYNELRNCIRKERQDTYQSHMDGDNPLLFFFRRKGILNSILVDIYDKLLLGFTEIQPSEYALYYSYESTPSTITYSVNNN